MMAAVVFWCAVVLVFYAYVGYPCALVLLASFRRRTVRKVPITPAVSFIIAAHNEERRLAQKIDNTLRQDYPPAQLEIIVASDASTDGTDDIARGAGPRVQLVRAETHGGKEAAQRLAVAAASGEILIFSDVATALAHDGVSVIVANFADPTVGCVSSVDRFVDADGGTSGEGAYVRYEMWLRALETRVSSLVGLSGSFFAARRETCRQWATDRQSDFTTLLRAVARGWRGVLDPDAAGYYRNITDERHEWQRKTRTVVRGMAALARHREMLNPLRYGLFAWQLASHKVCRWLVPFAMAAAAAAGAALAPQSTFYAVLFRAQLVFYAAALVGLATGAAKLRLPAYLLLTNGAILNAWLRFACGERMTCWAPSDRVTPLPHASSR